MKLAVIDAKDIELKFAGNTLKYGEHTIPFHMMDMLILNHRIKISTKDMLSLNKADISILLISYNSNHFSLMHSANPKSSQYKLAQYKMATNPLKKAKYFVAKKIKTHHDQLKENNTSIDIYSYLRRLVEAQTIPQVMAIEGEFAKAYFALYFSLFPLKWRAKKRTKRPPEDPLNAIMSYWYSLYYHTIASKLVSSGLEPAISFLHTPFRSHFALASDFLELFRSHINQAILGLVQSKKLNYSDFSKKNGVYLKFDARKKLWEDYLSLVQLLKPLLDKEVAKLKKEIMNEQI